MYVHVFVRCTLKNHFIQCFGVHLRFSRVLNLSVKQFERYRKITLIILIRLILGIMMTMKLSWEEAVDTEKKSTIQIA